MQILVCHLITVSVCVLLFRNNMTTLTNWYFGSVHEYVIVKGLLTVKLPIHE